MNKPPSIEFDGVADIFADYGTSVRGYVRYQLTQRNLTPFLSKRSMNILDVGGGSGPDTAWLVSLGHKVTLVEPSAEQRNYASRRFNFFLNDDERLRITVIAGSIDDLPPKHQLFDMVLIHGVAMYQIKPAAFIERAVREVKKGGLVSIIEKGYQGAIARSLREKDHENLRLLRTVHHSINHLQQDCYAFLPAELSKIVGSCDCEVLQWSGIRVISDDMDNEIASMNRIELKAIVDAEFEQGQDPSIRGQGQLLHFIARKN